MDRKNAVLSILQQLNVLDPEVRSNLNQGFQNDYSIGRDDTQQVFYRKRDLQELNKDAPMATSMLGNHQGITRLREATGRLNPAHQIALEEAGMQLRKDKPLAYQVGQFGGTFAADLTQDTSRSLWWLINALQASGQVVNDYALQQVVPELWGRHAVTRPIKAIGTDGKKVTNDRQINMGVQNDADYALKNKMVRMGDNEQLVPMRGYSFKKNAEGDNILQKNNYSRGMIAATAIPTGLAINTGLGLMTPFGGAEGYKAVNPSPEDPTKTNNVIAEVAEKYILGKTGGLLPYNEFKKVRPDVSKAEYAAYQADKFDNSWDLNPMDGDISLLGGALKANVDGIHGAEVSMLGRSLPVNTGLIPFTAALAGTALGGRYGHKVHKKGAMGALVGGLGANFAGQAVGSIIENERRRRNGIENGELPL
jgi:hypothetical protein